MINFKNVNLSFSDKKVIHNLNIQINRGEHVCIAGESGKGKSTVLKLVQGYLQADNGLIEIDGEPICAGTINQLRRKLTIVPQNINLPVQSGIELLSLLELENRKSIVNQILQQLGLTSNYLRKPFDEISGGEKQRIVIAVCLSQQKEIVLMDEPTASLDEASISLLEEVLKEKGDVTILSTSHNKRWQSYADRIIQL